MTPYDLNVLGQEPRPFFAARWVGGQVKVEGTSECLLGQNYPARR